MMPVIKEMQKYPQIENIICVTGQHDELLYQVLDLFDIKPDYDLHIMHPNQTLFSITADILRGIENVLSETKPDLVLVHGDTTTAYVGALAAFYSHIPIGHVEAGLRSWNKQSPFPEEMNRVMIDHMSELLFCPTQTDLENLLYDGISGGYVTGNTSIDVFKYTLKSGYKYHTSILNNNRRKILITAHRRENLGQPLLNICAAVNELSTYYPDIDFIWPLHPNPKVREIVRRECKVLLIDPLDIMDMHNLMNECELILTDSGGIQEEAPYLGKPVLVLRDNTERNQSGILVGTDKQKIINSVGFILENRNDYVLDKYSPYGDGHAAERIVRHIIEKDKW